MVHEDMHCTAGPTTRDDPPASAPRRGRAPWPGPGDVLTRRDVQLILAAVRGGWPVPAGRRAAIVAALARTAEDPASPPRAILAIVRALLAMDRHNLRLDRARAAARPAGRRRRA